MRPTAATMRTARIPSPVVTFDPGLAARPAEHSWHQHHRCDCLETTMTAPAWTVQITFSEDEDKTRADAVLTGGAERLEGWGRARRNPTDPDVPAVGEEIAAARALSDLAHHLLDEAAHQIESWEGHSINLS
jgi:hypothetical protein